MGFESKGLPIVFFVAVFWDANNAPEAFRDIPKNGCEGG